MTVQTSHTSLLECNDNLRRDCEQLHKDKHILRKEIRILRISTTDRCTTRNSQKSALLLLCVATALRDFRAHTKHTHIQTPRTHLLRNKLAPPHTPHTQFHNFLYLSHLLSTRSLFHHNFEVVRHEIARFGYSTYESECSCAFTRWHALRQRSPRRARQPARERWACVLWRRNRHWCWLRGNVCGWGEYVCICVFICRWAYRYRPRYM